MRVLSLFDGISCGMVALERADIPVERYVAYEIDENAIKISAHNYPMIEQKGDVFNAVYTEGEFDILIGGSPCTYWSIAKSSDGRETTSSGFGWELFMQYVRAFKEAKPKYFLYENNESMSDAIKEEITKQLGVEPIMIDSADFSAQHRKRYYWTNIAFEKEYEKSTVLFEDIMDKDEKNYSFRDFSKWKDTIKISKDGLTIKYATNGKYHQDTQAKKTNQKWNTLVASNGISKGCIWYDDMIARYLTRLEVERLQTLPDGYTNILKSLSKSCYCVGNGWTVDVIAHIFKGLLNRRSER